MIKNFVPFIISLLIPLQLLAQPELQYYLPENTTYRQDVPTPKAVLGYQVGEWHASHDQLAFYMRTVAEASDRVTIQEYARSYESRPLLLLTVTSPENHARIDEILEQRQAVHKGGVPEDLSDMPAVVWLGYSVHGNEASGANSSLLTAYHLAAAEGDEIEELLENTVILVDPCYNPDGFHRFSTWVNMHKNAHITADSQDREYDETWPGGRTNHYWFDLNRDWLLLQHPESKGRIAMFQKWKPNILTDHHEMGGGSTFFFQPGIPSRVNPLTPSINQELTGKIAEFHAKALDRIGSSYYSKESFDDFYYGKGSTYPDVQGSIGILFEQASSRGHAQKTGNGILTFPFTIRNQFTVTLSTLEAARALKEDLQRYQLSFYQEASQRAGSDAVKAYIFGSKTDPARNFHLLDMLTRHGLQVHALNTLVNVGEKSFSPGSAYVIPMDQPQYSLAKGIFRTQTEFRDSLFYDVSTWTMPLAYGLDYAELSGRAFSSSLLGSPVEEVAFPEGKLVGGVSEVGYAFEWDHYYAPQVLFQLQKSGIKAKVLTKPASFPLRDGSTKSLTYGAIVVPVGIQPGKNGQQIGKMLEDLAEETGLEVYALKTGLASSGVDMGSNSLDLVRKPNVAILVGEGVSSYEAGQAWHLFDQRMKMPVTKLVQDDFNRADIDKYNVLVLVNGSYRLDVQKLKDWVRTGGTVIGIKGAIRWLNNNGLNSVGFRKKDSSEDTTLTKPYADLSNNLGAKQIGGSIFRGRLDITHPIGYGYRNSDIAIFRNHEIFAEHHENPYATPLMYAENPLLSGYISDDNLEMVSGSAGILVDSYGRGRIISMVDDPNFRAFWYGTNKLFLNAVFFGNLISSRAAE